MQKQTPLDYAEAWAKGDIDENTFDSLMDDERILLESEATVVQIMISHFVTAMTSPIAAEHSPGGPCTH